MKISILVALVLCAWASAATAGDKAGAEAAFQQGKRLMKAAKYADACNAFETSRALDAQLGTSYNLALCYEKLGRLASAWAEFRELAQRDSNKARKRDSAKHAAALQPRLIKLLITSRAPGAAQITRNGQDVSQLVGVESPVDPGDHAIAATASGYRPWSVTVSARQEGRTVQVTVPDLEKLPDATTPAPASAVAPTAPRTAPSRVTAVSTTPRASSRKPLALIVGGGGLAVTAGGLVFGALASSKWSSAKQACGGDPDSCMATGAALAAARDDQRSAKTFGNVSTVLVGVGAAAVVAGVVLYMTSPSGARTEQAALRWIPTATPDGFAVTAAGRF